MPRPRAVRRLRSAQKKKAPVLSAKQLKRLLFVAGETRNPERYQLIVWLCDTLQAVVSKWGGAKPVLKALRRIQGVELWPPGWRELAGTTGFFAPCSATKRMNSHTSTLTQIFPVSGARLSPCTQ